MHFHEKLRAVRTLKSWSQDKMAEKLGYSVSGYGKVERGKTKIDDEKAEEIIKTIGIDWQKLELLLKELNGENVFNFAENCNHNGNVKYNVVLTETQCVHELEKAHLIIEQQAKEIGYLKEENTHLKEIISLIKKQPTE